MATNKFIASSHTLCRFEAKISKLPNGCWQWIGAIKENGYGTFKLHGRMIYPHRWSYEHFVGPIPDGMTIDHLCRNRACCNPEHLEVVTSGENTLRGDSPSALNKRKTHCKCGRPFDGIDSRRRRTCSRCLREKNRRADAKRDRHEYYRQYDAIHRKQHLTP